MGEWSKKVGEAGEGIASEFLRMIGWGAAQHGVELPCVRSEAHKVSDSGRRTHGIDYLFPYRSPLVDGIGQNLVVSVKFSVEPYHKKNPRKVFFEHFTDLAHTLECFKNSEARRELSKTVPGVSRTQDIGVLLWINNDKQGNGDVIGLLHKVNLPETLIYEAIYVVDNKRAQFVFDSVNFARHIANGCDVTFFYADTGKNVNPLSKVNHGLLLPVEYVNSSVLALRLADKASPKRVLLLSTLETFSEDGLKRLLGLAQSLSQDWCSKVILAFPDYDPLNHSNVVQTAKACFPSGNFVDGIEVDCYDEDFRTLRH
jgi:hypothetical protein